MKVKRAYFELALLSGIAAYFAWFVFWSGDSLMPHSANADNRSAIIRLHAALNVGDDRDGVLEKYWSHRTRNLQLHAELAEHWCISMPLEFGATDWTLILEFRKGRVSAIRVRTSDSPHRTGLRPKDAPPDKEGGDQPF